MSTAINLSEEKLKRFARTSQQRQINQGLSQSDLAIYEDLVVRIERAAKILKNNYGATRVILFGSFAHLAWFSTDSDVDLAVEGIPAKDYFRAWGVVEDFVEDRLVDLVDLQDVSPTLRAAIEKYGREF